MKKLLYAFFAIMAIAACTKEIENNGGNNNDDGTISRGFPTFNNFLNFGNLQQQS